jgi:hypothetical protein
MGAVYLGRAAGGQIVAVKVIRPGLAESKGFRERFESEVQNAKRVASFCTAAVIGSGVHEGLPYLVTEYIEGPTLYDQVDAQGALPPGTLHGVAVGTAAALTAIHVAGLVHRDLKPSNVILSMSGPRVIDFGIARALDATSFHTATGDLIGSPGWMAPEHLLRQQVSTASDVFAWGCLVAYAGRARHPYGEGEPIAMIARIIHGEPELDDLPAKLAPLVAAALSKDPGLRPTAQQLLLDLVGGAPSRLNSKASQVLEETWHEDTLADTPVRPAPEPPPPPVESESPQADTVPRQASGTILPVPPAEPEPATEPRSRTAGTGRRRPYALGGGIAAAVAAVAVAGYVALGTDLFSAADGGGGGGGGGASASAAADPLTRQGFAPVALRRNTDVGRSVAASSLEFTAGHPRCGGRSYAGQPAQGRLCLVPVSIRNVAEPTAGRADPVRVSRAEQRLIDSTGAERSPVRTSGGFLATGPEVAPGGMIAGELVFDLPAGATPAQLKLSAAAGEEVSLWV